MYRALRWQVGVLRQFFAVDPAASLKLIKNPDGLPLPELAGGDGRIIPWRRPS